MWVESKGAIVNSADLGVIGTQWNIAGAGDFNADGFEDVVWENLTTGQVYVWFMSSTGTAAAWGGPGGTFSGSFIRDGSSNIRPAPHARPLEDQRQGGWNGGDAEHPDRAPAPTER